MGQAEIKQALDGATDYLTQHPDEAAYTDSVAVARLANIDELRVDVTGPDGASLTTDMPTSVGGGNAAPSPGWFLRAAEASCVATLIVMRAASLGVVLRNLEVTVDSQSNDWGILGIGDGTPQAQPAGPMSGRVSVTISGDGQESDLRQMVEWAVDHCPVTDAVRRAIPLSVEVSIG
jgi:uncharacterized OsmC-like protein